MSADVTIEASGLTKRYGAVAAVDGIDFRVAPGECVGFLGPNGAGKTTSIRMLTGFTPVSAGSARIFGLDVMTHPREVKSRLGVCPQEDNLDSDFSVRKNLLVYARYFDIPSDVARQRADELLALFQLTEKASVAIRELSGGMKRRLMLARALLNAPRLLVLDEPTTGLDPQVRHLIWQRVRTLRADGVTVLLTTHYMEEAAQLCDRVILMDGGRILLSGTPRSLIADEVGREVVELWGFAPEVAAFVAASGWPHESTEERIFIHDRDGGVVADAIGRRFPHQERLIRHATLEDVFLRRAGRTLRD